MFALICCLWVILPSSQLGLSEYGSVSLHAANSHKARIQIDLNNTQIQQQWVYVIELKPSHNRQLVWAHFSLIINDRSGVAIQQCDAASMLVCYFPGRRPPSLKTHSNLSVQISSDRQVRDYNLSFYRTLYNPLQLSNSHNLIEVKLNDHISSFYQLDLVNSSFDRLRLELLPYGQDQNPILAADLYSVDENYQSIQHTKIEAVGLWAGRRLLFAESSQLKAHQANQIYICIIGREDSSYKLAFSIIRGSHYDLQIPQSVNEYLLPIHTNKYHLPLTGLKDSKEIEVKLIEYSGNLKVILATDEQCKNTYAAKFFHHQGDSKFVLAPQEIELNNLTDLYLQIEANEHECVFEIQVAEIDPSAHLLSPNCINFENYGPKTFYFVANTKKLMVDSEGESQYVQARIDATVVSGQPDFQFRYVLTDTPQEVYKNHYIFTCLPKCLQQQTQPITHVKSVGLGLKRHFVLRVSIDEMSSRSTLMVFVTVLSLNTSLAKGKPAQSHQILLEYSLWGKITQLRDRYPIIDSISMTQTKYYQYYPLFQHDTIKICYTQIIGMIGVVGSTQNPLNNPIGWITPNRLDQCVEFPSLSKQQPVYIKVYGQSLCKYVLTVTNPHEQSLLQIPQMQVLEDIEYSVSLSPFSQYTFVLHPIHQHLKLTYTATKPISLCLLQTGSMDKCENGTVQDSQVQGSLKQQTIQGQRKYLVKFMNPSMSDTCSLDIKYHSGAQHCELKQFGQIYEEDYKSEDVVCFKYHLPMSWEDVNQPGSQLPLQISVNKLHYLHSDVEISLCGALKIRAQTNKIIEVDEALIRSSCYESQSELQQQPLLQISMQASEASETLFKIQYLAQFQSDLILLPPSVRYRDSKLIHSDGSLQTYLYNSRQLEFENNTIILLQTYSAHTLKISGVLTNDPQQELSQPLIARMGQQVYTPSMESGQLQSIFISDNIQKCQQITQKHNGTAPIKNECMLLLTVVADKQFVGEHAEYSIEVRHGHQVLKEFQPSSRFLQTVGDTEVFLFYYNSKSTRGSPGEEFNALYTALLQASTQNQECVSLRVETLEKPSSFSVSPAAGQPLIFDIQKSAYVITTEAVTNNCHYTLTISTFLNNPSEHNHERVKVLSVGYQQDLKLKAGQVTYFVVSLSTSTNASETDQSKIMFMRKYGEVKMFAQAGSQQMMRKVFHHGGYSFTQTDFGISENFPNLLKLDKQSPLYVVAALASKNCEGTLVVHQQGRDLTIPASKSLFTTLNPQESMTIKFYAASIDSLIEFGGELDLLLVHGKIDVQMNLIELNQTPSNRNFRRHTLQIDPQECCETDHLNKLNFNAPQNLSRIQYFQVIVHNENPSPKDTSAFEVSLRFLERSLQISNIDLAQLEQLKLNVNQQIAISTVARSRDHKVVIAIEETPSRTHSPTAEESQPLSVLLKCIVVQAFNEQGNPLGFKDSLRFIQNTLLLIEFDWGDSVFNAHGHQTTLKLSLTRNCSVSQLSIRASVDVLGRNQVLLPWHWAYVSGVKQLAIPSANRTFLLDVFACSQDDFWFQHSSSYSGLQSSGNQSAMHVFGNQPHVIRLDPLDSISFLRIRSPEAIIRYIVPDESSETGVGYLRYQWKGFDFRDTAPQITMFLEPVMAVEPTKTRIYSLTYQIRVYRALTSNEATAQVNMISCPSFDLTDKFILNVDVKGVAPYQGQDYVFDKSLLLQEMDNVPHDLEVRVTAMVSLHTPPHTGTSGPDSSPSSEQYKFVSMAQLIHAELLEETADSDWKIRIAIMIVIGASAVILALGCVFTVYLLPILQKNRRRMVEFVEQEPPQSLAQPRNQMQQIPPSSDRSQIQGTEAQLRESSSQEQGMGESQH